MSSISRWYLDAQHSFSFKRYTKFRALHYNQFKAALPSFKNYLKLLKNFSNITIGALWILDLGRLNGYSSKQ